MKNKIIVVDDEHQIRNAGYLNLEKNLNNLDSSLGIEFDIVTEPNQLQVKLQKNVYSGAIVDAVLNIKWNDFDINQALKIIGKDMPIALISERWDGTNASQIDEALKKPNCKTFLHWRDIDPGGNGQIDYAIRTIQSMIANYRKLFIHQNLEPAETIRILHISDLQTAGGDNENIRLETQVCADKIKNHWQGKAPTFIVFTGDVVEHGSPGQYKKALEWFNSFFKKLYSNEIPANNVFYVPGNHDVNIRLASSARIKLDNEPQSSSINISLTNEIQDGSVLRCAYDPFRDFLSEVWDCPLINKDVNDCNFTWIESRFRHLGVVFYGINTAQPVNPFDHPGRSVNADSLARIEAKLKNVLNENHNFTPLVIGVSHHSPIPDNEDTAVENPDVFRSFFNGQIKTALYLHGHAHEYGFTYKSDDNFRLVKSCAGTLTKAEASRPSDSLRGFNLLSLERENHIVERLKATSYGWTKQDIKELSSRNWVKQSDGMFGEEYNT